jgi:hypothetical protein
MAPAPPWMAIIGLGLFTKVRFRLRSYFLSYCLPVHARSGCPRFASFWLTWGSFLAGTVKIQRGCHGDRSEAQRSHPLSSAAETKGDSTSLTITDIETRF